jgi:ATP-binding cassette subfamily A (ABC1) protein 3
MAFVNIIFFLILGVYLDQVFPNEFGKKKHPLFFIKCFFKNKEVVNRKNSVQNVDLGDNIEEISAELREKEENN